MTRAPWGRENRPDPGLAIGGASEGRWVMSPRAIVLLVVVVLAFVLVVENSHSATYRLLFWTVQTPLVALTLVLLGVGFVAGYITARILARRRGGSR